MGEKHRPVYDRDPTIQAVVDFVMSHGAHYALLGVPATLALLAFVGRIVYLRNRGIKHNYGSTKAILWPTQLLLVSNAVTLLLLASSLLSGPYYPLTDGLMSSAGWMFLATLAAIKLNLSEHRYGVRASDFLLIYYTAIVAASIFSLFILLGPQDQYLVDPPPPSAYKSEPFRYLLLSTVFTAIALVFEAFPRTNTRVQRLSREREQLSPYDQANLFSRITFHYAQPLMSLGAKRPLVAADIDGKTPKELQTHGNHEIIAKTWLRRLTDRGYSQSGTPLQDTPRNRKRRDPPSLLSTVLLTYRSRIVPTMIVRITSFVLMYVPPFLFTYLLRFFAQYTQAIRNGTPVPPTSQGLAIVLGMFASNLLSGILLANSSRECSDMAIGARAGLIAMIYHKALRLSPVSRQKSTLGEVTNHMSVDAEVWMSASNLLPIAITIPIEVTIAVALLYNVLGWSVFAGLAVFVAVFPLQKWLTEVMNKAQRTKLAVMDKRLRVMTELISNMKIIKFCSLESVFREKVDGLRKDELGAQKSLSIVRAFLEIVFSSVNLLITMVTFVVYATVGGPNFTPGPITPEVIFVGITIFARLSIQLGIVSLAIGHLISLKAANHRIQQFLLQEEIDSFAINRFKRQVLSSVHRADGNFLAIDIESGTFSWTKPSTSAPNAVHARTETSATLVESDRQPLLSTPEAASSLPVLHDLDLHIYDGKLAAIIGRVGQGKSSLLSAIIGEMYKQNGSVSVYGDLAYVPQQAWIVNANIRDNILFGQEFDKARYDQVVYAAGLLPDLEALPAGDLTEIGERGINLSGGQKQRVALARAVYQDADIYLLDDPLSAVDANVDQHLWHNLIGPTGLLKDKTRVLVTHGIHHLHEVDQIVVIKDGRVAENGEYQELLDAKHIFHNIITEYDNQAHSAKRRADKSPVRNVETVVQLENGDAKKEVRSAQGALVVEEKIQVGKVDWKVYLAYAKAISIYNAVLCVLLYIFVQACQIATNVWLARWTSDTEHGDAQPITYYLAGYGILVGVFLVVDLIVHYIANVVCGLRGARTLHDRLLTRVMRMPISFFDVTPTGRVLNRFSSDIAAVDTQLPSELPGLLSFSTNVLGIICVIAYSTPSFLIAVPPLAVVFFVFQHYYIKTSGALKRLYSVSKSPLYQHFSESLAGVATIRATRGIEAIFERKNEILSDVLAHRADTYMLANRWLTVRLYVLTSLTTLIVATLAVLNIDQLDTSLVGLALSYILSLTNVAIILVRTTSEVQNLLVSVERIEEYADKPIEAPTDTEPQVNLLLGWPRYGRIEFKNYSTRYREGMDYALRDVSLFIEAREKIGIVGRTGAGKSTIALALFRLLEAADSFWSIASDPEMGLHYMDPEFMLNTDGGKIEIDGVDISRVGLRPLRERMAIMPQEVTLFAGTIRDNIDPFHEFTERELWETLERAHLKDFVAGLEDDLMHEVSPQGENFSAGQKALIGLARALLRPAQILILDEATASVDVETDALIQKTIRKEFKDCTVITIAHRIKTVLDYDKVLVLEDGQVKEFDTPAKLLEQKETGLFYRLAQQAGEVA
ncbi:Multidrug resistance-associated protein 1 [Podila verticillata]|nr:Multidrug resistance-associated protein 1 [Podila verticillata]